MNTWGSESTAPFILNRDTRWVSGPLHAPAGLPPKKEDLVPNEREQQQRKRRCALAPAYLSATLSEADGHALAAILRHTHAAGDYFFYCTRKDKCVHVTCPQTRASCGMLLPHFITHGIFTVLLKDRCHILYGP
jgi:hypothetical protein